MNKHTLRSSKQNKIFYSLLTRLRISEDDKRDLVLQFTEGRTEKSSRMYFHEMEFLLNSLQSATPKGANPASKMRKKVFYLAHTLGWELPSGAVDEDKLNNFLVNRGHFKKILMKHSTKELIAVINQLEQILKKA